MAEKTEDRREDNATDDVAQPVHTDGKTEQDLINEAAEAASKKTSK